MDDWLTFKPVIREKYKKPSFGAAFYVPFIVILKIFPVIIIGINGFESLNRSDQNISALPKDQGMDIEQRVALFFPS